MFSGSGYPAAMRLIVTALLILLALVALPACANGLHRCIAAGGGSIFTDQICEDIGATARPEPAPTSGAPSTGRLRVHGCARTSEDLQRGLQSALAAGDVNQIASFYHWPGITTAGSVAILKRLQAISGHPVLSVDLIHPQQSQQAPDADGYATVASAQHREASGIQIVQSRSDTDDTPVRTSFALTQYLGCWWVHF
jgi:hypothetical protein